MLLLKSFIDTEEKEIESVGRWGNKENFLEEEYLSWAFQVALVVKNLPANARDLRDVGWIPGLGR